MMPRGRKKATQVEKTSVYFPLCLVRWTSLFQEVGLCGEFTLDGRASSGSSSRTLSAVWNVSAAAGGPAVATVERALAPFHGLLLATLNATALEIGFEFSFTLTVSNFLGAVHETAVTVTRM